MIYIYIVFKFRLMTASMWSKVESFVCLWLKRLALSEFITCTVLDVILYHWIPVFTSECQLFVCHVFVCKQDGSEVCMKEVPTGESIFSVLTILDLLTVSFLRCFLTVWRRQTKLSQSNILQHLKWLFLLSLIYQFIITFFLQTVYLSIHD